jgi:threonine dehydrogenase-like Zn-dependent dehydrogenase
MLGTVLYSRGDIRCEEVAEPEILHTDAILKLSDTCIRGSDL